MKCHYCPETSDLRPYGPRGSMVCFACAMATRERMAETKRNYLAQLDACGDAAVIDGTHVGPYPLEHAAPAAPAPDAGEKAPDAEGGAAQPAGSYYRCLDCGSWPFVKKGNHHPWCGCGSDRFDWGDERKEKPE